MSLAPNEMLDVARKEFPGPSNFAIEVSTTGPQGGDAEVRRGVGPGGGGVLKQRRDVRDVSPDGVPG